MFIQIEHKGNKYQVDLSKPIDISIPIKEGIENVNCFNAPPVEFSPVKAGDFIGSTREGGPVNFFNIRINPHGNGTHTECVGHIAKEKYTINRCLQKFHHLAKLVTIIPVRMENGDRVILRKQLEQVLIYDEVPALIIRTMPNDDLKLRTN